MKTKKLMISLILIWISFSMFTPNVFSNEADGNTEQEYVEILVSNYSQNNFFSSQVSISNENSNINFPCVDILNVSEENLKNTIQTLQDFDTRYVFSENCSLSAELIHSKFSEYGLWAEYDYFNYENHTLKNVVATLNGTSDNIYIISAHYDSINWKDNPNSLENPNVSAPGADDDGSGVSAVLECARIMSKYSFNATIKFVLFSAEEEGLIGSKHYTEKMKNNDEKIVCDIQLDMIGYGNNSVDIVTNPESEWIAENMENTSIDYGIGLNVNTVVNSAKYSDHASFWDNGYSGVCLIENVTSGSSNFNPHYHSKNDTIDKLNFTLIRKTTQLCIATLAVLANLPLPENVDKYALLVGNSGGLDYTDDDVYDMCDVLINNCYFDPQNIRVLIDATATKENIKNNITWLVSNAKPDDVVVFSFSGHGGNNYILVYNNRIWDYELDSWFEGVESNLVVIIDSCKAGSMIEKSRNEVENFSYIHGAKGVNPEKMDGFAKGLAQPDRIVLAACAANQFSYEEHPLSNGVFTYYLAEGFKSALADNNSNGWVSVEEAFYYAQPRTDAYDPSANSGQGQDPQIYDGIDGELDLSSYGDLIINNAEIYSNKTFTLNKNLTITSNGNLTLNNVTLLMNCTENGSYHIEVLSGGQLYIYNSNITSANEHRYLFWVRKDSMFEMRDSELHGCGYYTYPEYVHELERECLRIEASNVVIENNIISNNYYGIHLVNSLSSIISNNIISNNYYGVYSTNSSSTTFLNNVISHNHLGIKIEFSSNVTIRNLTVSDNGITLYHSSDNFIENSNINWGGLYISYSSNNIVRGVNISGIYKGVEILNSSGNVFMNCYISSNEYGVIICKHSNNNVISNCTVYNNYCYGISIDTSFNNAIMNSTIFGDYSNIDYHDIYLSSSSYLNLLNTTFNRTRVSMINSSLTVSWYLNINVLYQNNTSVENADVTINDCFMNKVFNGSTDEKGWIKNIVVQEYAQNQTGVTYFTPYNITASKNGYYGSATVDMNQNMEISIYLEDITPPDADAGNDQEIDVNTTVYFDGSNSTDNSGVIVNYTWTFADNGVEVTLYGVSPNYTFYNSGVFTVTLNVTDGNGNWNTKTVNIRVKDKTPPKANAGEYQEAYHGIMMRFDGSNSTDNVGIVNYTWSFFDNIDITLYGVISEYVFLTLGIYTVTLTVKDEAGNSDTDTVNIIVKDVTKPAIKIVSPEQVVHSRDCILKCVVTDNVKVERVEVSLNNQSWSSCIRENTDEYTTTLILEKGGNTIYVRATDSSGNVNITSITVFVEAPENVFPVFTSDTVTLLICIIFCIAATIILEHKPKRKRGL